MIYLDHAATTPVPRPVADAMYTVLTEQSAEKTQLMEIAEALRNSTAFGANIILLAIPVLLAPSPVHFQAVLEIGIG